MQDVYASYGISRQSHAQSLAREKVLEQKVESYIGFIEQIREFHPGMGLRKMYEQFNPEGIGRDAFIALGLEYGFRLRVLKNPVRTTYSVKNNRYQNLLTNKRFTDVNQIWASDIFYFPLNDRHYYVVLILDVYSRRIVGYQVADNMRAQNNIAALQMALKCRGVDDYKQKLIHHSDRGSQYISNDYTSLLEDYNIQISMCIDVLENAHMERANGIIKNDYLNRWPIRNFNQLRTKLKDAVENYNNRAHSSLENLTPLEFETYIKELSVEQRPVLKIFTVSTQNSDNPNQLLLF
jgi:putative transposase